MSKMGELILRKLSRPPGSSDYLVEHYERKHQDINIYMNVLENTFPNFRDTISEKCVLDIGCGGGLESLAISMLGAKEVYGIDIRINIDEASEMKKKLCPNSLVDFCFMDAHEIKFPDGKFDAVVTCGSFEHFNDPFLVLKESSRVLRDGGRIYLTSGVWSHPWGAHMYFFTKMPWVQFLFSEETIMNVRSLYRNDGARKYSEVEGGLNKVGIRKFNKIVNKLNLKIEYLSLNPVKGLTPLTKIPLINEFFSNLIVTIIVK